MHIRYVENYVLSAQPCLFVFSVEKIFSHSEKESARPKSRHKGLDPLIFVHWICLEQRFRKDQGVALLSAAAAACTRLKCSNHI